MEQAEKEGKKEETGRVVGIMHHLKTGLRMVIIKDFGDLSRFRASASILIGKTRLEVVEEIAPLNNLQSCEDGLIVAELGSDSGIIAIVKSGLVLAINIGDAIESI